MHHRSLCPSKFGQVSASLPTGAPAGSLLAVDSSMVAQSETKVRNRVPILPIAKVVARGKKGQHPVNILLDCGSTRSFARLSVLEKVGARGLPTETVSMASLESERRALREYPCYELELLTKGGYCGLGESIRIVVNGFSSISAPVSKPVVDLSKYHSCLLYTSPSPRDA